MGLTGTVKAGVREGFVFSRFVFQVLALAASSLLIRTILLRFNILLRGEVGSAAMGMIELMFSVRAFAMTFSCAGVNLAASRLSAEEAERGSGRGVREAMRKCLLWAACVAGASGACLFLLSEWVGTVLLGSTQTILPLRVMALGLPFCAISATLGGYFSAMRRAERGMLGGLLELLIRVGLTLALLRGWSGEIERAYLYVVIGVVAAEGAGCIWEGILFYFDLKKHISRSGEVRKGMTRRLLSITAPLAASSYVRSGLVTLEHMLIPWGLRQYGESVEGSLSAYGVLSSMALPILFLPACLSGAVNGLLIPEVARAKGEDRAEDVKNIGQKLLSFTLTYGIGTAGCLLCFASALGRVIYDDMRVGEYLLMLAPLIPVMYFDTAVDTLLKGTGEQVYTMGVNIVDAGLSAILVFLLVPKMGVAGYITVIIISEMINATLSYVRLKVKAGVKVHPGKSVLFPLLAALGAGAATRLFLSTYIPTSGLGIAIGMGMYVGVYIVLIAVFGGEKP